MNITVPGKTFLLGEYAVLQGGDALIFTHDPKFQCVFSKARSSTPPFHQESPAGKFYQANLDAFNGVSIDFNNPYHLLGGLGASSAEFLSLYLNLHKKLPVDNKALLKEYWRFAYSGDGQKPSGADLIAQAHGGLCHYNASNHRASSTNWIFPDLGFVIIHTQKKLPTHNHLKALSPPNLSQLIALSKMIVPILLKKDSQQFIELIQHTQNELETLSLSTTHSLELLDIINRLPHVLAAKGCGAMGADTIAIFCSALDTTQLIDNLKRLNLHIIATHESLSYPKISKQK